MESGLPASLITAIPNGIDLTPYKRRRPRHKDERGMVIGTVARLHRQKALDVMFEAAKLVLAAEPSVRFVVGGTGPLEDALKAKLRVAVGALRENGGLHKRCAGVSRRTGYLRFVIRL